MRYKNENIMKFKFIFKWFTFFFIVTKLTTSLAAIPDDKTIALLKPKLNSDRIAYFFGSFGVEQIPICATIFPDDRISNLYSIHDGTKIMRTLAIVDFSKSIPSFLMPTHQRILEGVSIGIALRDAGWEIVKKPLYFGEMNLSSPVLKRMHEKKSLKGAVHIYELEVKNGVHPELIRYCTIVEIHSPQYLTLTWLQALYDKEYPFHHQTNPHIHELLNRVEHCLATFQTPS